MNPEPWLRGAIPSISPLLAPTLRSLEQAREDLEKHTAGLTPEQVWASPNGLTPLGFHLRHIGGSVDRLVTYLMGHQLNEAQIAALHAEAEPGASREQLLARTFEALAHAEEVIRGLDPATLAEPRQVGRQGLPTTAIGLVVHIAEHTQRHVGSAITTAKIARNLGLSGGRTQQMYG